MIKYFRFRAEDALNFIPLDRKDEITPLTAKIIENNPQYIQCVSAYIEKGVLLYIAGVTNLADGVGEVFLHRSSYLPEYQKVFCKGVKILLESVFKDFNYRRVNLIVKEGDILAEKWAYYLGFELECNMKKYFPDNSSGKLFVKFREE